MKVRPIRNDHDLDAAYARVDELWGAPSGTEEGDELSILYVLISDYERENHALPAGDPIEVIRFKMHELGLSGRELGRRLGWGNGRVSEVMNHRRGLTLTMIQQLADVLSIPASSLVGQQVDGASHDGWLWVTPTVLGDLRDELERAGGPDVSVWIERTIRRALASPMTLATGAPFNNAEALVFQTTSLPAPDSAFIGREPVDAFVEVRDAA